MQAGTTKLLAAYIKLLKIIWPHLSHSQRSFCGEGVVIEVKNSKFWVVTHG